MRADMVKIIKYNEKSFNSNLDRRINSQSLQSNKIELAVKKILNDIKRNNDKALFKYAKKFDNIKNPKRDLKVKSSEIKKAKNLCTSDSIKALKLAANRIEKFHKNQMPKNIIYKDKEGMSIKTRWLPIERAGVYAPGGKASYPSSVLMSLIPQSSAATNVSGLISPEEEGTVIIISLTPATFAGIALIRTELGYDALPPGA
jgi:histidinol dehydrogenase